MAKRTASRKRKPKFTDEQIGELIWNTHSCNIDPTHRELYLHGYHMEFAEDGEEPGVDYRMATIFEKNLNILDRLGDSNVLIHMHTNGGCWNDGMAVYDCIKQSKSPTTVLAYSHSRSMSSIIPMAADLRIIHANCDFMIHLGTMFMGDRAKAFLTEAEQLKKSNAIMLDIYYNVIKDSKVFKDKTETYIKNFLNKKMDKHDDWYLNAEEAVHYGFYDGILGSKEYPDIASIR
jgi:ATP-dependent protease ClpP protease subunit